MSDSSDSKKSSGAMQSILVAVAIAVLAGGSAPWWWNQLFPHPPSQIQAQTPAPSATGADASDPASAKHSPPPPTMGALEEGTNLQGGDFAPTGMQSNSAEECSYSCVQDDACKAMTFVKNSAGPGVCWLKSSVPAGNPNPAMTSAVKIYH